MGYTQGKILPEAKFFSSCEPVKPDKLFTFKIQWWDRRRVDSLISKERNQKEERNHGNLKSSRASYVRFENLRIVFLGASCHLLQTPGVAAPFQRSWAAATPTETKEEAASLPQLVPSGMVVAVPARPISDSPLGSFFLGHRHTVPSSCPVESQK